MNNFFKLHFDQNRIYGLDILRAWAILFVLIQHGSYFLPDKFREISVFFTYDGVSMFFVLSGFLIGGILIKTLEKNKPTFRTLFNFWIRRWLRTAPNYYLILFLLLLVIPFLTRGIINNPLHRFDYIFLTQNWNSPHPAFFSEAWSLSVEEWFYLIIPVSIFLLVGVTRLSVPKAVITSAIVVMLTCLIFRYIKFLTLNIDSYEDWNQNLRKEVITRLDSNMFGLIGALVAYYFRDLWVKHKNILFIAGIVVLVLHKVITSRVEFGLYNCVFSFSLVSFGVLLILPFLSEYKKGKGIFFKFFTFISIISYSLYLLNLSMFYEFGINLLDYLSLSGKALVFARYSWFWIFSVSGSFLLYKFYEKPMMELREKFR